VMSVVTLRHDDGGTGALIDARQSDEDPTRSQNIWTSNSLKSAFGQ
jgi:hypothetical protein